MNRGCKRRDTFGMSIDSPDFIRERAFRGFLVILGHESSCSSVVKKNSLWFLRHATSKLLRSEGSSSQGPFLRHQEDLPGSGDSASLLPEVRGSETGEACMAVRQHLLHEEICLCGRAALSGDDDSGRGKRVSSRLEDGQGDGQALHAGAVEKDRNSGAEGDRNRRDIDQEGAYISNSGERSDSEASDLVWRKRSFRRKHGRVLRMAGAQDLRLRGQVFTLYFRNRTKDNRFNECRRAPKLGNL